MTPQITMEKLEEAEAKLKALGVHAEVCYVEVQVSETRESPSHGRFNTNKGGTLMGMTVAIDPTKKDSSSVVDLVIKSLLAKVRRGTDMVMAAMD